MPELRWQLTFEGKVAPDDDMGAQMTIEATAPIPAGVDDVLRQNGSSASLNANVETDEYGGFTETGEIRFGAGTIRYVSRGEGFIEETEEPDIQQGCVIRRIDGGSGIFEGATGYIASTFTVDENARYCDSQSAVIFTG